MEIRRSERRRHPITSQRPLDCLTEMLMEFIAIDHASMPTDELRSWLTTVGMCLAALSRNDRQTVPKAMCRIHWLNTITNRLARAFPGLPRHMIRRTIEAKALQHWEP